VSCVASGYEDKISSLKMQHNFIRDDRLYKLSETSFGKTKEDSQQIMIKELDYQIRLSGVFSKPP
jgi:hypothetical protein